MYNLRHKISGTTFWGKHCSSPEIAEAGRVNSTVNSDNWEVVKVEIKYTVMKQVTKWEEAE